jgi:hypothetical protein
MSIFPVGLTLNSEDLPSMRHIRAQGALSAIEDCCGFGRRGILGGEESEKGVI